MFCKKCGKEIHDDSSFCSYCGDQTNIDSTKLNLNAYTKDTFKNIKNTFFIEKKFHIYIGILIITLTLILITPNNSLIGTWKSTDDYMVLTFKPSGEFINNYGFYGLYETKGNTLILYDNDGYEQEESSYKIISGTLKLTSSDSNYKSTFKRCGFKLSLIDIFISILGLGSIVIVFFRNNKSYVNK